MDGRDVAVAKACDVCDDAMLKCFLIFHTALYIYILFLRCGSATFVKDRSR